MKKYIHLFMLFFLSATILIGCGQTDTPEETITKVEEQVEEITLTISTDNGEEVVSSETVEIEEGAILMDVLVDNYEIESTNDGFITSIEGIEQNDNKYWMYEVNDEQASVGASEFELKPGDDVVFDLHVIE